tara:strand:+ start:560 stop:844 length:285 start_codon:yes stop_codon:yes gene_type:complete
MDELMDLIGADESASQISDKIKDMLYAKAATKIDDFRPAVADSLFGDAEDEVEDEVDTEVDAETDVEIGDEIDTETEAELEVDEPEVEEEETEE